jgi:hypothetical protein
MYPLKKGSLKKHLNRIKKVGSWITTLVHGTNNMVYFKHLNLKTGFISLLYKNGEKFMKLEGSKNSLWRLPCFLKEWVTAR